MEYEAAIDCCSVPASTLAILNALTFLERLFFKPPSEGQGQRSTK